MKKQHKHIDETPEQEAEREEQERLRKERHEQNVAFAAEALSAFAKHYPPARNITEAVRFLTTAEIIQTVNEIYPTAAIEAYTLSLFLKQAGYRYIPMPDRFNPSFKWMIK
jgi:methylmalonyl-CoA mutase N-terminal domain/subunit